MTMLPEVRHSSAQMSNVARQPPRQLTAMEDFESGPPVDLACLASGEIAHRNGHRQDTRRRISRRGRSRLSAGVQYLRCSGGLTTRAVRVPGREGVVQIGG